MYSYSAMKKRTKSLMKHHALQVTRSRMVSTFLGTLAITAVIALALCLQTHVSEHRRLPNAQFRTGDTVAIKREYNTPIYDYTREPVTAVIGYKHTFQPYSVGMGNEGNYRKKIARGCSTTVREVFTVLLPGWIERPDSPDDERYFNPETEEVRSASNRPNGKHYYGLGGFGVRTKYFAENCLTTSKKPEPTQEEIQKAERKNAKEQALKAKLKSIPHPGSWLKMGCTYHVEACKTMVPKHLQQDVKEDNYEATCVSQYEYEYSCGQWYVSLNYMMSVDPKNIVPQRCVASDIGAECTNCS